MLFRSMFSYCSSLTSLDLSGWDVASATDFRSMFLNCTSLKDINVLGWQITSAKYISRVFYGCTSLTTLDLSTFDFSNSPYYNQMLQSVKATVYVKDQASKDFINKVNSGINCVIKEA